MYYLFGPFRLDPEKRILLRDDEPVRLTAKAFDMLLAIAKSKGSALTKEELTNKVWGVGIHITDNNFNVTLRTVRKALGDSGRKPAYIVKTPQGYQIMGAISEIASVSSTNSASPARYENYPKPHKGKSQRSYTQKFTEGFGGHFSFVCVASTAYAAYYAVALMVEVSYEFNRYKHSAIEASILAFCWIYATSILALRLAAKARRAAYRNRSLAVSVVIFLFAAATMFAIACFILPETPVTRARIQTYGAQAAYLKDIGYILPLGIIFLVTPFHLIIALQLEVAEGGPERISRLLTNKNPGVPPLGTIYLRSWLLGFLLLGLIAYSLVARAHLFDNLLPGPYMGLFMNLIHIRMALYFGLAILCLTWYHRVLTDLKRECLTFYPPEISN